MQVRGARLMVVGGGTVALAALAPSAAANVYEVTTGSDHKPGKCTGAECTLREAVIAR